MSLSDFCWLCVVSCVCLKECVCVCVKDCGYVCSFVRVSLTVCVSFWVCVWACVGVLYICVCEFFCEWVWLSVCVSVYQYVFSREQTVVWEYGQLLDEDHAHISCRMAEDHISEIIWHITKPMKHDPAVKSSATYIYYFILYHIHKQY